MPQNVSSRLDEAEGGLREAGKKRFEMIQAAATKERKNERVKKACVNCGILLRKTIHALLEIHEENRKRQKAS